MQSGSPPKLEIKPSLVLFAHGLNSNFLADDEISKLTKQVCSLRNFYHIIKIC